MMRIMMAMMMVPPSWMVVVKVTDYTKINVNVDLPFNTCSSAASFVFHSYAIYRENFI